MAEQKPAAPKATPAILRYGLALASVALGTAAAFLLDNYHFRGVEYPLFLFAIAMTVWYAGVGPGILAVVLSSISFNYFFTDPGFSFYVSRADIPYYLIFILFALLLTWFSSVRWRVEQQLLESRESAKRMGALIDDLLAFSRIARAETRQQPVSLGELVKEMLPDLQRETEGRAIAWNIGALPDTFGDRPMLRLVLVNLIANAVKFARTRTRAEIEIGPLKKNDAVVRYFRRHRHRSGDRATHHPSSRLCRKTG